MRPEAAGPSGPARRRLAREWRDRSLLLAVALLARVAYLAAHDPLDRLAGGDGPWYVQQGWRILHHALPAPLGTVGPLYPLMLAGAWAAFPHAPYPARLEAIPVAYLTLVRGAQVALAVLTVWLGYALTRRLSGSHRAGMVAGVAVGLGPAFVMEPFNILTETLFIALFALAVSLYSRAQQTRARAALALAGGVFALAGLTRPVLLLFPLLLAGHLVLAHGPRAGSKGAVAMLGVFLLTLSPWTAYLYRSSGRWIPEGLFSNLWIGAVGEGRWPGRDALDAMRRGFAEGDRGYATEAMRVIREDPVRWLRLRASNLARSLVQPHGTADLGGPGIKQRLAEWLREDRSAAGLLAVGQARGLGPKVLVYACHYAALLFGLLGGWLARCRWRSYFPLYAAIGYLAGAYGVLTVEPRYLFPIQVLLWVLAGSGVVGTWDRLVRGVGPEARPEA